MRFKEIIGQRDLINKLIMMVREGRIPHAQLFLGAEGTQKLALAIAYGQFINCHNPQYYTDSDELGLVADSCGACPSCLKYQNLAHPDLHFFFPNNKSGSMKDSSSEDYLELWREFIKDRNAEFTLNQWYDEMGIGNKQGYINKRDCDNVIKTLSYKNFEAKNKVLIFWMAEKFYHDIATRLLKVLEEPSEGTVFLLIAEHSDQIPATILSRTQLFRVPKINPENIAAFLQRKYDISYEEASQIAFLANGNLIEAETLYNRSDEDIFNHTQFVEWMRMCLKVDTHKMSLFAKSMTEFGREKLKLFLNHALDKIRWSVLLDYQNSNLVCVAPEERAFLEKFAPFIHSNNLMRLTTEIEKAIYHIERNANGNIVMMDLSILVAGLLKKKQ